MSKLRGFCVPRGGGYVAVDGNGTLLSGKVRSNADEALDESEALQAQQSARAAIAMAAGACCVDPNPVDDGEDWYCSRCLTSYTREMYLALVADMPGVAGAYHEGQGALRTD